MPGLVIRRVALFGIAQDQRFALGAHQHFVLGQLEINHRDDFAVLPRGVQSRFVDQIGQIRARQARRSASHYRKIDVIAQRNFLGVDFENSFAAVDIRPAYHHPTVETAGAQQRGIEHIRAVGRRHQNHAFVGFEAVHLHQQLIQRLLALVVTAAETCAAVTSYGVDFIDEDDAGRVLLALFEQIAHAAGAHANEHFDEIRARNREKGHAGFAGNGARQ